ncbi:MAG TPA: hypothetical protein VFX30_12395 [bacterium]|nr:hypothetical protein [bacterium]
MTVFASMPLVSPASIELLQRVVAAVPSSHQAFFVQQALSIVDFRGLDYEHEILTAAEADRSRLPDAMALFQRFGRLSYAAAPHAERIGKTLGVSVETPENAEDRVEDRRAQWAWDCFSKLESGAAEFANTTLFYDPVGAMSHGINHYLERQGRQAQEQADVNGGRSMPASPSFGVLSRESSERLQRYNRGENDQLGDLSFDFAPHLQMVVVPKVYGDLFRRRVAHQVVIPASDLLEGTFTVERARRLPDGACIETSIKGLPGGKMPREHFEGVLKEAGKEASVLGVLGFLSAGKVSKEQRAHRAGRGGRGDLLDIVITDPHTIHGVAAAKRRAGPGAVVRTEHYKGVPVVVVENLNLSPPVRYTVVSDEDVIKANEKASIDKNLQAIYLGGKLFERMLEAVEKKEMGDPLLYKEFGRFYGEKMEQAERDILDALAVEGIPENKRILLPGVLKDLYGSWTTKGFEPLYKLVRQIFAPDSSKEEWQEAMVLLKLRIGDFFDVRNPQYAFCAALDRAAVRLGRWLSRAELEAAVARLRAKGMLIDREGRDYSDEAAAKKLGLNVSKGAHAFFSTIPEGLLPEGYQIADQLPERYKRKVKNLPVSYQEAHLLVQRMQNSVFFDADVYRQVVEITKDLAVVQPGSSSAQASRYVDLLGALNSQFEKGLGVLKASKHVFPRARDTENLLTTLVKYMRVLIEKVKTNEALGTEEISLLNQGVIEALTLANLFYILPPEESDREAKFLMKRMKSLLHYASRPALDTLFPQKAEEGKIDPVIAGHLGALRRPLSEAVGGGLVELTYRMNVRIHSQDQAVTKKNVVDAFQQIRDAMTTAIGAAGPTEKEALPLLAMMAGTMDQTIRDFQSNKKLSAQHRLLIYQALIESLIHTRRFLVLPDERAGVELQYTARRFQQISNFVRGLETSPLWYFGNGKSLPPAAK